MSDPNLARAARRALDRRLRTIEAPVLRKGLTPPPRGWIHPFPNGNGRLSRMTADLLVTALGEPRFSWGGKGNLMTAGELRRLYVQALRAADAHDLGPLMTFARS